MTASSTSLFRRGNGLSPAMFTIVLSVLCLVISSAFAECPNDNGNGTHTDPATGLIWQTCAVGQTWNGGQCTGSPGDYSWEVSLLQADINRFQKNDSWILPTQEQLNGLLKTGCGLINRNRYWSASPDPSNYDYASFVDFSLRYSGNYDRNYKYNVQLVRGSQLSDINIFKTSLSSIHSSVLKSIIVTYKRNDPDDLILAAKKKLLLAELSEYRGIFKNARSSSEFDSFIIVYRGNDPDNLIPKAEAKKQAAIKRETAEARVRELAPYRDAFKNAQSSSDFDNFISTYRKSDPDKLIPKAEAKKRVALAQERQQAERERQQWERDRPYREQRENSRRMCEAQKTTCLAQCQGVGSCASSSESCGRFVSCESRCREINCY